MLQRSRPCCIAAPRHVDANLATRQATPRRAAALCRMARHVAMQHSASVRYPVINLLGAFSQISHYQEELAQVPTRYRRTRGRTRAPQQARACALPHARTHTLFHAHPHARKRTRTAHTHHASEHVWRNRRRQTLARSHARTHTPTPTHTDFTQALARVPHRRGRLPHAAVFCAGDP